MRHDLVVKLGRQTVEKVGQFWMRLEGVLANHGCQRICREEMLVVLEHDEMKRRDASIRGKSKCNVDLLVAQRLVGKPRRSEAHTSELQSLMRISYAVFS